MTKLGNMSHLRDALRQAKERTPAQKEWALDRGPAQAIIEALRFGVAPVDGASLLAVGRDELLGAVSRDLDSAYHGGSSLRILNGKIGMGKTFILRMLQDSAFRLGFATSFVTLTSRECPLCDMRAVYQHIIKGLRVDKCRDRPALEWILENWADTVRDDFRRTGVAPWSVWQLGDMFKEVLAIYFEAVFGRSYRKAEQALSWINGDMGTVREANRLGVHAVITCDSALEMLGNTTRMIRALGVRGLVILLDEAEIIPSICTLASGEQAIHNLDNLARSSARTPYTCFIYATTPYFLQHVDSVGIRMDIPRGKLTTLESLSDTQLATLARKIRKIHECAYDWEGDGRVRDANLRELVAAFLDQRKAELTPRAVVRAVVQCLDLCYDSAEIRFEEIIDDLLEMRYADDDN